MKQHAHREGQPEYTVREFAVRVVLACLFLLGAYLFGGLLVILLSPPV